MPDSLPVRRLRILVVEDHPDTLKSVRRLLERMGHTALAAATADQALSMLMEEECDVLFCDVNLPGGNAWELLRRVPEERRPPCLVSMSIRNGLEVERESRAAGYHRHLGKPFHAFDLKEVLHGRCTGGP